MIWNSRKTATSNGATSLIDENSELEGKCSFAGTLVLNGKFKGEIEGTGTLIIGETGIARARMRARAVLIEGEVVGDVAATERIELRRTARVVGDVAAPVVVIEEGGMFDGQAHVTKPGAAPVAATEEPATQALGA